MNFWIFKMTWVFLLWFATFTPSEKVALTSAFLVLIGVIGEYVVEVKAVEERKLLAKRIKRLSMALLVLGLSGDVLGIVMGQSEMAVLTRESGDAATSARTARQEADAVKGIADEARADAKDALAKSQTAQRELAQSEADAAKAQTAASNALHTASEAGQVAHDARKEVAEAAEELKRVKAQRSILHLDNVIVALQQFSGAEYMFSGVGADEDSLTLIKQIDDILQKAGWKRQPAHGVYPAINVFEPQTADQSVTVALMSGVNVSVDSQETFAQLQAKQIADLPEYVRAAISLTLNMFPNLYPPQETGTKANVIKGNATVIRITVGHKP